MPGKLTTHVLDTANGCPAANLKIELRDAGGELLAECRTNPDGRCEAALLSGDSLQRGQYQLRFHVGEYFRTRDMAVGQPAFLEIVPVDFGIADPEASWHIPLLVSPWAYSTYRGS